MIQKIKQELEKKFPEKQLEVGEVLEETFTVKNAENGQYHRFEFKDVGGFVEVDWKSKSRVFVEYNEKKEDPENGDIIEFRKSSDVPFIKESCIEIMKVSADKKLVGVAVYSADAEPDADGDTMNLDDLKLAAEKYMMESQKVGIEHKTKLLSTDARVVESFVTDKEVEKIIEGQKIRIPKRSWWVLFKIGNASLWNKVKEGFYRGISMGGNAKARRIKDGVRQLFNVKVDELSFVRNPATRIPILVTKSDKDMETVQNLMTYVISEIKKKGLQLTDEQFQKAVMDATMSIGTDAGLFELEKKDKFDILLEKVQGLQEIVEKRIAKGTDDSIVLPDDMTTGDVEKMIDGVIQKRFNQLIK